MSKIIFNSKGVETTIQCTKDEKMKEAIKKLTSKIDLDLNTAYFIYNGRIVNEKLTFEELSNELDKERNTMNILVGEFNIQDINTERENIKQSRDIICPKCKTQTLIKIQDYLINFENCENGHYLNELSIKDFINTQVINMTSIICDICKNNTMSNTYNNEMHYCFSCGKVLCPTCKAIHDISHKYVIFEDKNLYCDKHFEKFTKFCLDCDKNLCMKCEKEHKNDKSVNLGELLPNENIDDEMKEFKKFIDKFNNNIKIIINKLENILNNINEYYNISNNFIRNNLENRNYQILKNINEILNSNGVILADIKQIINEDCLENKIKNLMNLYDKININNKEKIKNEDNQVKLNYTNYISAEIDIKFEDINKEIQIINSFDQCKIKFPNKTDNNYNCSYNQFYWTKIKNENDFYNEKEIKDKCLIKINNEIIPFSYYHKFSKIGKYKIEYIFRRNIKNINSLFAYCLYLKNIDLSTFDSQSIINIENLFYNISPMNVNMSNFNASKITNMQGLFSNLNIISLNLSNFNAKNVTDMSQMFYYCNNLQSVNLSNLNAQNVTNMSKMFYGCIALRDLNLSNIKNENITDMNEMFTNCKSLYSLDLSSFKTEKVIDMSGMFSECSHLSSLDLSHLNVENVADMNNMFYNCSNLRTLNLSNFNAKNAIKMGYMFFNCERLNNLNTLNFRTENAVIMSNMFANCKSLKNLNLLSFKTQHVTDMSRMFYECSSLTSLKLQSFNTQNVINMSYMFYNCRLLKSLNLSNFTTRNVSDMRGMFSCCKSLKYLNLSNFTTEKVHTFYKKYDNEYISHLHGNLEYMFSCCESLEKNKIITNDKNILITYDENLGCIIF